jgi:hypothetical protein
MGRVIPRPEAKPPAGAGATTSLATRLTGWESAQGRRDAQGEFHEAAQAREWADARHRPPPPSSMAASMPLAASVLGDNFSGPEHGLILLRSLSRACPKETGNQLAASGGAVPPPNLAWCVCGGGGGDAHHRPENRISTPGRISGPAWELGQFGGARSGGIGAAGTICKRN